ncbi:MAG: DEAD/DEAH box helicase [Ruminococcus sp.]
MEAKLTSDSKLYLKNCDPSQFAIIKSWNLMKYSRKDGLFSGIANLELLNKLNGICRLPPRIESYRLQLQKIQDKLDYIRNSEKVETIIKPPVKVNLFEHQLRAYNMAMVHFGVMKCCNENPFITNKGFGLLFEMGCGKTLTAIAITGTLYQQNKIKRVLIVAPTSVCSVWPKEYDEYADYPHIVKTLLGTKSQRLRQLNELRDFPIRSALQVAVINYESVWRDELYQKIEEFAPDLIIADESQRIKTHDAQQSKAMHLLGDKAKFKLILSGTPVQNNALDLFSQFRFLDPTVFGTNYYAFKNRYCVMGGFKQKKVVAYRDLDQLIKKEVSVSLRVTKEEALDLPEQTFENRYIELSPKERKIYNEIKKESTTELENGESITATTVLTKLLRLQQLTGGFLVTDESDKPVQVSDGKLKALEDIIEDYVISADKKLVVFCRFRSEIDVITKMLEYKKLKFGFGCIYGDIKLEERGAIVKDFQENPETKVFVAQIDTAGLGITLTAADTCVYYSVNFNYAAYSQSLARIHRIGQRNTCTYIHLVVEKTVDELILKALKNKEDLAHTIVDDWRKYF